jgi:hypothetical protein
VTADRALPPVSVRRANAQRRIARQRATISEAWQEFARHEVRGERRVRQVLTLTRRIAGISALLAAGLAIRRAGARRSSRRATWRGLARPLFWFGLLRRVMRRNGSGPGGKGNRI